MILIHFMKTRSSFIFDFLLRKTPFDVCTVIGRFTIKMLGIGHTTISIEIAHTHPIDCRNNRNHNFLNVRVALTLMKADFSQSPLEYYPKSKNNLSIPACELASDNDKVA